MITKFLLIGLLFVFVCGLRNQTSTNQAHPLLGEVYFEQGQIFYIGKDGGSFGHIEKSTGSNLLKWSLQANEKILYASENQVMVSRGLFLSQYEVFSKKENIVRALREGNVSSYQGYQYFKFGFYVLADNSLSLNEWKTLEEAEQTISLQTDQDQQLKQLEIFDNRVLLFSTTPTKNCFTQVDYLTVSRKKCIDRLNSNAVRIQLSGQYVFVIYSTNTQLLDKDFNLVQSFQIPVQQHYKGSASLQGFRTYDIESKTYKNYKLVSHRSEGKENTLTKEQDQHLLKEGQILMGKIPSIASEPVGVWLNKKEGAVNRVQGKYELLVQLSSGILQFYEIRASENSNSAMSLKWSH